MTTSKTPFAGKEQKLQESSKTSNRKWYVVALFGILTIFIIFFFMKARLGEDRYRTLELLQFEETLDNHERLLGGKFKMTATVNAELGTEIGNGKLIAFRDPSSRLVLPVLIPSSVLDNRSLNKGQEYQMEVEVLRGGLLQVNHIEKK